MNKLDEKDTQILVDRETEFNKRTGPRVGDFVKMLDGTIQRFSHDWGDDIQTSNGGSYHISKSGYVDMSGGLNRAIMKDKLTLTDEAMPGSFWFFHHDRAAAHNVVDVKITCRVYQQNETH